MWESCCFVSTHVSRSSATAYSVTGDLRMHGVTKPVTLAVTLSPPFNHAGGIRRGAEATGSIDRREFGIGWDVPGEGTGVVATIVSRRQPPPSNAYSDRFGSTAIHSRFVALQAICHRCYRSSVDPATRLLSMPTHAARRGRDRFAATRGGSTSPGTAATPLCRRPAIAHEIPCIPAAS